MAQPTTTVSQNENERPSLLPSRPKRRIHEGDHVEIDWSEVPYDQQKVLGTGGHAFVDQVRDVLSGSIFARKIFVRNRRASNGMNTMLRREVDNIRALAPHPHVVHVHATYICGRNMAILLQPVADENLANFLSHYRSLPDTASEKRGSSYVIFRGFGCLAHALEYMHREGFGSKPIIRHKDIKPTNILLHQGFMLFADFGVSRSCAEHHTTTDGKPEFLTAMYCAPEVADHDNRNRKSDVFSLGCVFLEMLAALLPHKIPDELLSDHSAEPYHRRIDQIKLCLRVCSAEEELARLIRHMFYLSPMDRPPVRDVTICLRKTQDARILQCSRCSSFDRRLYTSNTSPSRSLVFGNDTSRTCTPSRIPPRSGRYGCPYPHCTEIDLPRQALSTEHDFSVHSFTCGLCTLRGVLYGTWWDLWGIMKHLRAQHSDDFPNNWVALQNQLPFGLFKFDPEGNIVLGGESANAVSGQYVVATKDLSFGVNGVAFRQGDRILVLTPGPKLQDWWDGEFLGKKRVFPVDSCKFENAFSAWVGLATSNYRDAGTGYHFHKGDRIFITQQAERWGKSWEAQGGGKIGHFPPRCCKLLHALKESHAEDHAGTVARLLGILEDGLGTGDEGEVDNSMALQCSNHITDWEDTSNE